MTFNEEIGHRIALERRALGFTQGDLAIMAGLSRPAMNNIEAGRQNVYAHTAARIAWALGVEVQCLIPAWQESEVAL